MPRVMLIAGPNGAGKSTVATELVPAGTVYLNADDFAAAMELPDGPARDLAAGRELLRRWRDLEAAGADFAVETTLATRSFAGWLARMRARGYAFELVFLYLPSADMAVARVEERVRRGGHSIPEPVIRRRYEAGLQNLFATYLPMADTWTVADASVVGSLRPVAIGPNEIWDGDAWNRLLRKYAQS